MLSNYEQAIFEVVSEECEAMIPAISEDHIFSKKFERNMEKLIKRRRKPYYKLISTGARRAACIIVAILVVSASALSVKAVRDAVYHFITKIFSDHTEIIPDHEQTDGYPETIEEEYYIADLPEGFVMNDYEAENYSVYSLFENDNKHIILRQFTKANYIRNFDNEQSEYNILEIDDQEYMVFDNDVEKTFMWDNGKYIFTLRSNCTNNDMINLCKSIKIKE